MFDFDAGKYAIYVWGCYGAVAAGFAWIIFDSLTRAAKWRREAERLQGEKDKKKP